MLNSSVICFGDDLCLHVSKVVISLFYLSDCIVKYCIDLLSRWECQKIWFSFWFYCLVHNLMTTTFTLLALILLSLCTVTDIFPFPLCLAKKYPDS